MVHYLDSILPSTIESMLLHNPRLDREAKQFICLYYGIDGRKRNQVLHLIHEQLESLRNGEVTELELTQTKAMLRNQYLLSLDAPQVAVETAYLENWLPETKLTDEEWLKRMEKVTVEDIQKIARQIELQAIFFLDGGTTNE